VAFDPQRHYPLGTERPDLVTTPGGLSLDQLSLHGEGVESSELRVRPETLRLQADVAAAAGRVELAANLRRAFSGIVAGNVKEDGIRRIEEEGPFEIHGDPDIMQALDALLRAFVAQGRMKIAGDYRPCYRVVA